MRQPFCLRRFKKLCLCTASLVLSTRLTMHKQSFLNLLRQSGCPVTKVYWTFFLRILIKICLSGSSFNFWMQMLLVFLNQKANYFHAYNMLIITSFTIYIDGKSPQLAYSLWMLSAPARDFPQGVLKSWILGWMGATGIPKLLFTYTRPCSAVFLTLVSKIGTKHYPQKLFNKCFWCQIITHKLILCFCTHVVTPTWAEV